MLLSRIWRRILEDVCRFAVTVKEIGGIVVLGQRRKLAAT
jgi:hypothetical protein